jgi:hypothetical protein
VPHQNLQSVDVTVERFVSDCFTDGPDIINFEPTSNWRADVQKTAFLGNFPSLRSAGALLVKAVDSGAAASPALLAEIDIQNRPVINA